MIKKAMILAAGFGTRLQPLTHHLPKPLVPIYNKPLLEIHIEMLCSIGVEEIIINLHHLPDLIMETIGNGERWGISIHYSLEKTILGTGGGLAQAKPFFEPHESFFFLNGDIYHQIDLEKVAEFHLQNRNDATLVLKPHSGNPQEGWIGMDAHQKITRVPDMPETPSSDTPYSFCGIHVLTSAVFPYLPTTQEMYCILRKGYRGLLENHKQVMGWLEPAPFWFDIGNPQMYLESHFHDDMDKTLLTPSSQIHETAVLKKNVVVGENAIIEKNVVLENCIVWKNAKVPQNTLAQNTLFMTSQDSFAVEDL